MEDETKSKLIYYIDGNRATRQEVLDAVHIDLDLDAFKLDRGQMVELRTGKHIINIMPDVAHIDHVILPRPVTPFNFECEKPRPALPREKLPRPNKGYNKHQYATLLHTLKHRELSRKKK